MQEDRLIVRAIDGDTIELEDGEIIRYIGIDTPEVVHPDKPVECYGPEPPNSTGRLWRANTPSLSMIRAEKTNTVGHWLTSISVTPRS